MNLSVFPMVKSHVYVMFINDFNWPSSSELEYTNKNNNNVQFMLEFIAGTIVGIRVIAMRNIKAGEELGVEYGWCFWIE